MKRSTKAKIKDRMVNITIEILEYFYNMGDMTAKAIINKSLAKSVFDKNIYKTYTEVPFANWLYRLRDQGYLKYTADSESIEFTLKSKLKLLNLIGKKAAETNYYHFISFDIPEKLKKLRDAFRRAIKNLGFKQIQKSLWVINKDVYQLVQEIALELKVEKYIVNIISAQSDIDGVLDKLFSNAT